MSCQIVKACFIFFTESWTSSCQDNDSFSRNLPPLVRPRISFPFRTKHSCSSSHDGDFSSVFHMFNYSDTLMLNSSRCSSCLSWYHFTFLVLGLLISLCPRARVALATSILCCLEILSPGITLQLFNSLRLALLSHWSHQFINLTLVQSVYYN